jgi:GNAT superfamily N-acetyltransferase
LETRTLTFADLSIIRGLSQLAEAEGFGFITRFADDCANGSVQLDAPGEYFYGDFDNDDLVALGGVTPDPYVHDASVGRVRHVFVRPEFRARGVGRALVDTLEARAQNRYARLRLRTDTAAAARFYERLGYHVVSNVSATHERAL